MTALDKAATELPQLEPTKIGTYKNLTNLYSDDPTAIVVREDRHRQKFDRKPLDRLIDSIRDVGQLQPGLCRRNEFDQIELVVGERRLRACLILKIKFLYVLKEEIKDPLLLEQMQLDENLVREDLTWQEEVKAKARLHTILQQRYGATKPGVRGGHSLQNTAEYIGAKFTSLQEDVTLATFLEVPEVVAAPNKTVAKKIARTLIENVKRQVALQTALASTEVPPAPPTEAEVAEVKLKEAKVKEDLIKEGISVEEAERRAEEFIQKEFGKEREAAKSARQDFLTQQLVYFNKRCILGKMEERLASQFPDETFDIVCFDPPWGVEFDKVFKQSGTTKNYKDSKEAFFAAFPDWIKLIFRKMKPDSHLYMFFGMGQTPEGEDIVEDADGFEAFRYRDFIYDTLHSVGFKTNRMPLIWHKQGAHTTRNPLIWPGRSYEPIAYARKGGKPLAKQGAPDVIPTPMPTPSIKDIHPSAKHPQIYKELLERSAKPGDVCLDPMGGSGMFGVAAESLRTTHALDWYMIEIDPDFKTLQLVNLSKGYATITGPSAPTSVAEASTTNHFESLTPGTWEWSSYFRTHPEEQAAMLEWRERRKK